ncbi:hypothetical protein F4820DRAFT_236613 [Hypoxylon rubiginosum]|uniref:Uncharacterized protein n=1 Tax=Hypoxylon rubiginosum TaxID=110542 RepID=A0ACB9Z4V4_9PEZI|nr:hypothetical protein F4820DRAFT_236613 [Hypoxylon rubiginosum]
MASPLSVGDCIAIIGVLIQGYKAISDSSDDAKALGSLQVDLQHMKEIFEQLAEPRTNVSPESEASTKKLNDIVDRCRETLDELTTATKKYGASTWRVVTYYRRISWSLSGQKAIAPIQARVQGLTASLSAVQSEIIRKTLEEMNADAQRRIEDLLLQLREDKEEIKYHIYASIEEPPDRKPVEFQDATGRQFHVPLELCQRFDDFLDFLKFSFRTMRAILPFVIRRDIWLFTPARNGSKWWYLITEDDWAEVARPGVRLGMSLFRADYMPSSVHSCKCRYYSSESQQKERWPLVRGPGQDSFIRFSRPAPPWSTLPIDLEFRWWSRPALCGPVSTKPSGDQRRQNVVQNVMSSFVSSDSSSSHTPVWTAQTQESIELPKYLNFGARDDVFGSNNSELRRNLLGVEPGREKPDEVEQAAFQLPKSRLSQLYDQRYLRHLLERGEREVSLPLRGKKRIRRMSS